MKGKLNTRGRQGSWYNLDLLPSPWRTLDSNYYHL